VRLKCEEAVRQIDFGDWGAGLFSAPWSGRYAAPTHLDAVRAGNRPPEIKGIAPCRAGEPNEHPGEKKRGLTCSWPAGDPRHIERALSRAHLDSVPLSFPVDLEPGLTCHPFSHDRDRNSICSHRLKELR
jgi:hypothetical protein